MSGNGSVSDSQMSMKPHALRAKRTNAKNAAKERKDDFIMDTNNSSIVSKRSVEELYYANEPHYFQHFTGKFKRRSPLINRGYWLRMRAIEHTVHKFLEEPSGKKKLVVNLGCGYDPLPWLFLGKVPEKCHDAVFVDVDYPQLMKRKQAMIDQSADLKAVLPGLQNTGKDSGILCHNDHYAAIGCDLRNLDFLKLALNEHLNAEDCSVAVLFVAEVSTAYMDVQGSQAVFQWAAGYEDSRFCLLEQHLPDGRDHPFAQTMLKHFEKLNTPLHAIGTIEQMRARFIKAGWPSGGLKITPLWDLWSDPEFLTPNQRRALDKVEPFDEWEEFALFGAHYFLTVADKPAPHTGADEQTAMEKEAAGTNNVSGARLATQKLAGAQSCRRFGAVLPATHSQQSVGLHAGLGAQGRVTSTDVYTELVPVAAITGPQVPTGLMCHTITRLHPSMSHGNTTDCLLVGGRAAPDKAFAECWLRTNGVWQQTTPLPQERYRHSAACVSTPEGKWGVLVFGGKTSGGRVLDDSLFWTPGFGWRELNCTDKIRPPPRFGALNRVKYDHCHGELMGGMSDDGCVIEDTWLWRMLDESSISWENPPTENFVPKYLYRFGAQLTTIKDDVVIVGGILRKGMLTRHHEIAIADDGTPVPFEGPRPLFVGHQMSDRLVLGGGATCFSFGTYWNPSYILHDYSEDERELDWMLIDQAELLPEFEEQPEPFDGGVRRVQLAGENKFDKIRDAGKPVAIFGLNLGPCRQKWTPQYLAESLGADRKVVVHVSPDTAMDFQNKNFTYETRELGSFLKDISFGGRMYLRSLSATEPSRTPTNLATDFPEIASDFILPPELEFASTHAHSSPLRISGPVAMWLHYDVMANLLCQVRGRKRLMLFPPEDVMLLGFAPGASSSSIDVFKATKETHPELAHCHPHTVDLGPGEVLYIPPMWLHAAMPTSAEPSIAVNVFFRSLESGYAAGKDVYGNRDLAAYEKGRKDVGMIARAFKNVPADVRRFYLARLGGELMDLAEQGGDGEAR